MSKSSKEKSVLTLALPEGKNLGQQTLGLLSDSRIVIKRQHPRAIEARIEGIPTIGRAIFCRPEQVRDLVAAGVAQLGITGEDVILEDRDDRIEVLAKLPYSRQTIGGTRCVLFTRTDNPANTLEDVHRIDGYKSGGHGGIAFIEATSMVASEYPTETKAFLNGKTLLEVIPCKGGSVEVLVHEGIYRYGVALVETGTTLAVNGLKEIEGGTIFDSCAVLIGNTNELGRNLDGVETESRKSVAGLLASLLVGTLEARSRVYLVMNAPVRDLVRIRKALPTLKSPTIQPLADQNWCSIASVVPTADVNGLMLKLMGYGATGFVTLPPSTVM